MSNIKITGGKPLNGEIRISGARNCALKVIHAAMFSNEDVIIRNVPKIGSLEADIDILISLGAQITWISQNSLKLNGSKINSFEIPYDLGAKQRTCLLLAGPLVHRFGQARLPKPYSVKYGARPINRFVDTWNSLGYEVTEDDNYVHIKGHNLIGANVNFKINTHMGTENAVLSSLFLHGDTYIKNAAEEVEVDSLIEFCNSIGGNVVRIEPRIIKVTGVELFRGAEFTLPPDKTDVVIFATCALATQGSVIIKDVEQAHLLSFVNVLTKLGARYEFEGKNMRIWHTSDMLSPISLSTSQAPGFLSEWLPFLTVLMTKASGKSILYDTVYTNRSDYIRDLNMMGANIKLLKPSEAGLETVISDDSYDIKKSGEPLNVIEINGPTKLKGSKVLVTEFISGLALMIAALSAEGKTELTGFSQISYGFDSFLERFSELGAQIEESE